MTINKYVSDYNVLNKTEHGNGLIMIKDAGLYGIVKKVLIVVVIFEYHLK